MNIKAVAAALLLALTIPTSASAEVDPFPGVAHMAEIPGTRISSAPGVTQAQWESSDTYINRAPCPAGSGSAISVDSWNKIWSIYCVKTWQASSVTQAWEDYRNAVDAAQRAAEAESRAWNEANPGKQKCVQWGPITSPDGGVSSGGVCANPVSAPTAPSGSSPVSAGLVSESDVASGSSSVSSSLSSSISPDPLPPAESSYRGNGYPYTVVLPGQVGITGCPVGFQAANGLIVVAGGGTYTECWPERAWTANRLGGEAWELYKATGGSYDPSVEIDRRAKVDLLKAKAKEIANAAALQTPGIERCSSWSGFGESGTECAYAFIWPSTSSASISPVITSSSTVSPAVTESSGVGNPTGQTSDSSNSASISVALSSVAFKASAGVIAKTAVLLTSREVEAQKISRFALKVVDIKSTTKTKQVSLPKEKGLIHSVKSLTPKTCFASKVRVTFKVLGVCQLEIKVSDSDGNTYEFEKRIRRLG